VQNIWHEFYVQRIMNFKAINKHSSRFSFCGYVCSWVNYNWRQKKLLGPIQFLPFRTPFSPSEAHQCEKEQSVNICCRDCFLRSIKDWESAARAQMKINANCDCGWRRVKRRKTCLLQGCVNNIHIIERNGRPNCFPIAFTGIYISERATYAQSNAAAQRGFRKS
jgi:hypothetical protein